MNKYLPISDRCRHKALFFDDNGVYVGRKRLDPLSPTFVFKNKGYNFIPSMSSFYTTYFLFKTKHYFYNVNDPMPLILNKRVEPVVNSDAYGVFLRTDILKKLNDLSKTNWLAKLLTPRNLIILAILFVVIWYFSSGGSVEQIMSYFKSGT